MIKKSSAKTGSHNDLSPISGTVIKKIINLNNEPTLNRKIWPLLGQLTITETVVKHLKKETINTWNGEKIELTISSDGYCFCPICGEKAIDKDWRPYDDEGHPSYDICSCGFEYGFDDSGEPPYEKSWENYRIKWLNDEIDQNFGKRKSKEEKINQLKNLGL